MSVLCSPDMNNVQHLETKWGGGGGEVGRERTEGVCEYIQMLSSIAVHCKRKQKSFLRKTVLVMAYCTSCLRDNKGNSLISLLFREVKHDRPSLNPINYNNLLASSHHILPADLKGDHLCL